MTVLGKIDHRKNIIILFLAFVFSAAFIDKYNPDIQISVYYLYEVVLFLACVITGIYVLYAKKVILLKHWIIVPFLLIIVWSLIEMLLFDGLKYAPKFFIYALIEIFIFINIVINFVDKEHYDGFIKYTCWVFMGLAFLIMFYYFSQGRFVNFNPGQSFNKYVLGFGALCCFYLMLKERKVIYGALAYILLILCVVSLVRKMWLALLIACIVMTITYLLGSPRKTLSKKDYRKAVYMILSLLIAILITAGILLLFVPKMAAAAMESLGSVNLGETSISDMSRRLANVDAINKFLQSPIIGNGWGDRIYLAQLDLNLLYHNCYLSVLCQLGVIGFVLYYGVFTYPLVKSIIMIKKAEYFYYGLFILVLWIFSAIVLYFMPLNRMPYYLWGPPLIFTLVFEAWTEKKNIVWLFKRNSNQLVKSAD